MSLYKGDMNSRILAGEKMEDVLKNPDAPKTDWKLENWSGGINPNGMYSGGLFNETSTPVVCKDGTKKMQPSSSNARYMDVCRDNGGRAEIKPVVNAPALPTKGKESLLKKISGSYNQNLIIAVVLVGGYFAYKKFKK